MAKAIKHVTKVVKNVVRNPIKAVKKVIANPADALLPQTVRDSKTYRTGIRPVLNVATDAGIGFLTGGPAGAIASGLGSALGEIKNGPKGYGGVGQVLGSAAGGYAAGASATGGAFNGTLANGGGLGEALGNASSILTGGLGDGSGISGLVNSLGGGLVSSLGGVLGGGGQGAQQVAYGGGGGGQYQNAAYYPDGQGGFQYANASGGGNGGTSMGGLGSLLQGIAAIQAGTAPTQQKPGVFTEAQMNQLNQELVKQSGGNLVSNFGSIANDPQYQKIIADKNNQIQRNIMGTALPQLQQGLSQTGGFGGSYQAQQNGAIATNIAQRQTEADNALLQNLALAQAQQRGSAARLGVQNNGLITPPNKKVQNAALLSQLGGYLGTPQGQTATNAIAGTLGNVLGNVASNGSKLVGGIGGILNSAWDAGKSIVGGVGDWLGGLFGGNKQAPVSSGSNLGMGAGVGQAAVQTPIGGWNNPLTGTPRPVYPKALENIPFDLSNPKVQAAMALDSKWQSANPWSMMTGNA